MGVQEEETREMYCVKTCPIFGPQLGLQWSEGKRRYLLDFVGGKRGTTGVSADLFVSQLQAMEEQTLQPFQQVGSGALTLSFPSSPSHRCAAAC